VKTRPPINAVQLQDALEEDRAALLAHPVYARVQSLEDLRIFQENHAFAVWDFMCLLKELQRRLTCVAVPWVPPSHPRAARLINEIVLGEETDRLPGGVRGHFDLYRDSMEETGAGRAPLDVFIMLIRGGAAVDSALDDARVRAPAAAFVRSTFEILNAGSLPAIAAAFTYGREDIIPDMFERLITTLEEARPGALPALRLYLERHVELDGAEHGPASHEMIEEICGTSVTAWSEALAGARAAIRARRALWDGVVQALPVRPRRAA
jgi:hypothetical protein